jgi:hypothetical protein
VTAEIAVMNKHGIALAADSAVTINAGPAAQGSKIYVSANKIFALSKYRPVAIMIYDSAEIMGLPWETVIKSYREQLDDREFSCIEEYVCDFASFVGENSRFFPSDLQDESVDAYSRGTYQRILEAVHAEVNQRLQQGKGPLSDDDIKGLFEQHIAETHKEWSASTRISSFPAEHEAELAERYGEVFARAKNAVFEKAPSLSQETQAQLDELLVLAYSHIPPWPIAGTTGVVFAGYGGDDVFPSLREIVVDEVVLDRLMWWEGRNVEISRNQAASVVPFAQNEMVARFMAGVDPEYQELLESSFGKLMEGFTDSIFKSLPKGQPSQRARKKIREGREEMLAAYIQSLNQVRRRNYIDSVVDAVRVLPLTELAEMAESLVNLTSFKRKVSMEVETVSEPIDVAVISAGDGFIWINRKHYFSPEQNHHFFANYYRKDYGSPRGASRHPDPETQRSDDS